MIKLVVILIILSVTPAYSYIDAGSGSMLLQAIMAAGLGVLMFFKQIKFAIINFIGSFFTKKTDITKENIENEVR